MHMIFDNGKYWMAEEPESKQGLAGYNLGIRSILKAENGVPFQVNVRKFTLDIDGYRQATHCLTDLINGNSVDKIKSRDYSDIIKYPMPHG